MLPYLRSRDVTWRPKLITEYGKILLTLSRKTVEENSVIAMNSLVKNKREKNQSVTKQLLQIQKAKTSKGLSNCHYEIMLYTRKAKNNNVERITKCDQAVGKDTKAIKKVVNKREQESGA